MNAISHDILPHTMLRHTSVMPANKTVSPFGGLAPQDDTADGWLRLTASVPAASRCRCALLGAPRRRLAFLGGAVRPAWFDVESDGEVPEVFHPAP
jgi:hypothetical protein